MYGIAETDLKTKNIYNILLIAKNFMDYLFIKVLHI